MGCFTSISCWQLTLSVCLCVCFFCLKKDIEIEGRSVGHLLDLHLFPENVCFAPTVSSQKANFVLRFLFAVTQVVLNF